MLTCVSTSFPSVRFMPTEASLPAHRDAGLCLKLLVIPHLALWNLSIPGFLLPSPPWLVFSQGFQGCTNFSGCEVPRAILQSHSDISTWSWKPRAGPAAIVLGVSSHRCTKGFWCVYWLSRHLSVPSLSCCVCGHCSGIIYIQIIPGLDPQQGHIVQCKLGCLFPSKSSDLDRLWQACSLISYHGEHNFVLYFIDSNFNLW